MFEQYYRINEAIGVSINLLPDGNTQISACSIVIKDNRLDFEKKVVDIQTVEELSKNFFDKSYIALSLSGKGVLNKQIVKTEEINQHNFSQIMPNAKFDDFYFQNFISGDISFVSVIRKTDADQWIELIKKQGLNPLLLSLGPFSVQNIIAQLNVYDRQLVFDGHIISHDENNNWLLYDYEENASAPFPLKVESEPISEKLVIAYASAFQLVLASKLAVIHANVASLETEFQKCIEDKKLKVKGFVILSIFFVLLLVNFLIFSLLNSSNAKLIDQVSRTTQSTNDVQVINDQIKNKVALLQNLGWDGGINKSVLIDQLASLLPNEISWREIAINPIDPTTSRVQKSIQFADRTIRVIGNSEKIIPVNEWIARVKAQKWVKGIQLDSYTYNTELNTGQFIIIINY